MSIHLPMLMTHLIPACRHDRIIGTNSNPTVVSTHCFEETTRNPQNMSISYPTPVPHISRKRRCLERKMESRTTQVTRMRKYSVYTLRTPNNVEAATTTRGRQQQACSAGIQIVPNTFRVDLRISSTHGSSNILEGRGLTTFVTKTSE